MQEFYCAAPWRGLHINPQGCIKTCCAGDPNMLGNLNEQTIEEILHGTKLQEIRQSLREGKSHPYCYNCVKAERYGRSERHWHNELNPDFNVIDALDTEHIPVLVDVRWNITCNLSCNYCGDKCSSKWAALKHIPFKSGARPYAQQVCAYLDQHREHIKEVALVGGEPLLLPENEQVLDVIPDDCVVTIITNASVELRGNKIFEKLVNRRKVGWSLSFDNIGDRLEYVRYGAKWELIERNVNTIKQLFAQGHWGGVHAVYNIYNCTRLVELTQWARETGVSIQWQSLYQPEYLDPLKHSNAIQQIALNEIAKVFELDLTKSEHAFFSQAKINLENSHAGNVAQEFIKFTDELENKYHSDTKGNFRLLWPEICENYYDC